MDLSASHPCVYELYTFLFVSIVDGLDLLFFVEES